MVGFPICLSIEATFVIMLVNSCLHDGDGLGFFWGFGFMDWRSAFCECE